MPVVRGMNTNSPAKSGMKRAIGFTPGIGIMIRRWGCSGRWTRCGISILLWRRIIIVRITRLSMLIRMEELQYRNIKI